MSNQLDIFGFDVNQLEEVKIDNPSTLSEVFNNIAAEMVFCLKQSVQKENLTFKGNLLESIKMPVKMFGFRLTATLFLADYYDFVNKGVKGIGGTRKTENGKYITGPMKAWEIKAPNSPYSFKKGPRVSHIRQWAKSKGLNEYAARTSIAHKGIRPRFFFDNCMKETFFGETFDRFKSDIRVVSGDRVAKGLKEILEK